MVGAFAENADGAAVLDDAAELVRRGQRSVRPGRFLDIESAPRITGATRVRPSDGVEYAVHTDGDRIRVEFTGKAVSVPAFAEPEVRHLLAAEESCADELPGAVDAEGRLVLIRSLVVEGLLTICR
jgi:hypothetical protein